MTEHFVTRQDAKAPGPTVTHDARGVPPSSHCKPVAGIFMGGSGPQRFLAAAKPRTDWENRATARRMDLETELAWQMCSAGGRLLSQASTEHGEQSISARSVSLRTDDGPENGY
jgi:hypothetical protein